MRVHDCLRRHACAGGKARDLITEVFGPLWLIPGNALFHVWFRYYGNPRFAPQANPHAPPVRSCWSSPHTLILIPVGPGRRSRPSPKKPPSRCSIDSLNSWPRSLGELEVRRGHGRGNVNFYRIREIPAEPSISRPRKSNISKGRKSNISDRENLTSRLVESMRERKKKGAPAAPFSFSPDKPEMHNPFWCDAHGFCHGERLPDHRPDCAREIGRRGHPMTLTDYYC